MAKRMRRYAHLRGERENEEIRSRDNREENVKVHLPKRERGGGGGRFAASGILIIGPTSQPLSGDKTRAPPLQDVARNTETRKNLKAHTKDWAGSPIHPIWFQVAMVT
jgi:hypothetical protein